jgi:hypothetical protein
MKQHFQSFSHMFYIFIKEGFINSQIQGSLYYKYMLNLKDNYNKIDNDNLINLLWALAVTEEPIQMANPIIPRLF